MATSILVPLDGSRLAEQALSCAITLGRGLSAELVLFRAISIPFDVQEALEKADLKPDPFIERLETEADEYLQAVSHRLPEPGLSFSHVIRHGLAADAILDFVEQSDVGLIVMASHGYTGINRWTHGSVAERVLQSAGVPVLLMRVKEAPLESMPEVCPWRRILVPLDGSRLAEQVLPAVTPIAKAMGCELTLFQVPNVYASSAHMGEWYWPLQGIFETADKAAQDYLDHLASDLRNQGLQVSTVTSVGPVAESIVNYAKVMDVDLIAMCTHGRTGLARWALGSVADRVLRAGDKPVLLVRAR